jgi:hypothetical protein
MSEDVGHHPSDDTWSRFTLLDGALLIAAFAVGMAMVKYDMRLRGEARVDRARPMLRTWARIFLLGLEIAGPPILLRQWIRGRRLALGFGEILWLVSLAFTIVVRTSRTLIDPNVLATRTYFLAYLHPFISFLRVLTSLVALGWLIAGRFERRPRRALPWTDYLGISTCVLSGTWIVFVVGEVLIRR